MNIKEYIIANYLHSESGYVKLMKLSGVGERLIIQKWLDEHQIIKIFIESWVTDLVPFKCQQYPDTIFYMKSTGEYVLENYQNSAYLYVRYKEFWNVLERKYLVKYFDIQSVIKYVVEETFKKEVKTPYLFENQYHIEVEEAFKKEVKTPTSILDTYHNWVEEAFKKEVKTPESFEAYETYSVEEAFKNNITK